MRQKPSFLVFLMTNDIDFRVSVFYYPLLAAAAGFLWWLLRGRGLSEVLLFSAAMFLFTCFVGLVYQAMRRGKLR